jgi:lipid-binding SYLF domain-containing protein
MLGRIAKRVAGHFAKKTAKKGKKAVTGAVAGIAAPFPKLMAALKKEASLSPVIHQEVVGALHHMQARDPSLSEALKKAYGYAVLPNVGKATAVLGAAFGVGEVFERGRVSGYAAVVQLTIGLQLGGQTYHELIIFDSKQAYDTFKSGKVSFAANASAVIISAGAAASKGKPGMRVFVAPEGGLMLEAAIGGQKLIYKPAFLGRLRVAEPKATAKQAMKYGGPTPPPTH